MNQKYLFGLVLAILLSVSYQSNAQNIGGGLIGGFNFSQIDGDGAGGYTKIGWNTGLLGIIPISEKFSFNTEMLYSQKGARGIGWKIQYDYLSIPFYLNYTDKGKYHFGAGFSYGNMISDKSNNFFQNYKTFDANILFNFYSRMKGRTFFNLRFSRSILPLDHFIEIRSGRRMWVAQRIITARVIVFIKEPSTSPR